MSKFFDIFTELSGSILGGRKYEEWKKQSLFLQNVQIKNVKLSAEIEQDCKDKNGILTYAEYLQIDQFGKQGYHNTHNAHGFTPSYKKASLACFTYMSENNIHDIFELGSGDGSFAIELCKIARKNNYDLKWFGCEVEKDFQDYTEYRFKKDKLEKFLGAQVKTFDEFPARKTALVVASYLIDSIPPEILINTKPMFSAPNNIMGISVKNGILQEKILNNDELTIKHITLNNSILSYKGISYDISNIKLAPYQRIYLTLGGFNALIETAKKVKSPHVFIIDEFRSTLNTLRTDHLLSPNFLYKKNRHYFNPQKSYLNAGEKLLYYPLYLSMIFSLFRSIGIKNIEHDGEEYMALKMSHKPVLRKKGIRYHLCLGVLGSGEISIKTPIKLETPSPTS